MKDFAVAGDWEPIDYDHLKQVLDDNGEKSRIKPPIIEKVGRVALMMSELHEGGIFVFFENKNKMQAYYSDPLKHMSVDLDIRSIMDLSDEELVNFANEDGAVLIDHNGNLHSFMAILNPKQFDLQDNEFNFGARHITALAISKETGDLCIVISQDGRITVYMGGETSYQM